MIGGIDDQIQKRITASGSNPDRLMQSYNQKKQLIDLLALQKLKSDKEAAARNMQMQMQQNPQTIKNQREAEVLDMTKRELTQQVGKTLAQKQQQSQQNLQRVTNQGIANAPAANRMRMANGGIVGFAGPTGSEVTLEDYQNVDLSGAKYGQQMTPQYKKIKSKQRDAELLDRYKDLLDRQGRLNYMEVMELERLQRKFSPEVGADGPEPSEAQPPMGPTPNFVAPEESVSAPEESAPAGGSEAGAEAMRRVDEALGGQEQPPAEQPPVATTAPEKTNFSGIATITAPQLDYSGDTAGKGLEKVFRGMSEADPSAARETGYKSALDKIGYTADEMSGIKALQAEQKGLEGKRLDPKKQARDRLISRLLGARGSTLGSTFRTSGLAGERTRGAQEAQEYALFEKRKKDLQDLITKQQGIRSSAYDKAQTDFTEAGTNKRTGIQGLSGLSGQSRTDVQKQAELKQAAEIANATNSLKKLDIESRENTNRSQLISNEAITNARIQSNEAIAEMRDNTQRETNKLTAETNKIIAEGRNMDQLNGQLTKIQKLRVDIQTAVADELKSDVEYIRLRNQVNQAMDGGNEAEYLGLQKQLKIIENRVLGRYQDQVKSLEGQVKLIQDRLLDLTSGDASYEVQR